MLDVRAPHALAPCVALATPLAQHWHVATCACIAHALISNFEAYWQHFTLYLITQHTKLMTMQHDCNCAVTNSTIVGIIFKSKSKPCSSDLTHVHLCLSTVCQA